MTDSEAREQLRQLAKEMGNVGYYNYVACEEFLQKAFEAGRLQEREEVARYAECYGIIGRKLAADIREKK